MCRDVEEEIDTEAAHRAAMTICGRESRSAWARADFELVQGDISESDEAWEECLRLYDTLMGVARQSWQSESFSPRLRLSAASPKCSSPRTTLATELGRTAERSRSGANLDYLTSRSRAPPHQPLRLQPNMSRQLRATFVSSPQG